MDGWMSGLSQRSRKSPYSKSTESSNLSPSVYYNAAKNLEKFYTESSSGINACGDERFMLASKNVNRCSSKKQESNRKTRDYTIKVRL